MPISITTVVFLEGVFVDRTAQGLKPRFLPADPPTDADIAAVLQTISRRVIRQLRKLGYLEADTEDVVPTGYDPASDEDPELARTMAASVQQRIAFGERAGQQVRRIGSGFGYEGERSILTGTRCASVHGFSLHANTSIPAHRRDQLERLLRYTARGAVALERLDGQRRRRPALYLHATPGPMAPPASNSHRWSCWRSSRHWSPCPVSIRCATAAAWHRIATCGRPSSRPHASKGVEAPDRPDARRRTGRGRDCSSASSRLTWHAARCVSRAGCGSLRRLPRVTSSRKSCGT